VNITLCLICNNPPPAEDQGAAREFGMQDRDETLAPGAPMPDGALRFTCALMLRGGRDAPPDFGGAWVHGKRGERFLYLGYRPGPGAAWIRRWKIPLAGISWELLDQIGEHPGGQIEGAVALEGKRVTLTPIEAWGVDRPATNR
jgi:Family of unknown function (DUF5990)